MANPRKPDHLHLLRGTFRKDRHGEAGAKPQPKGEIGKPPGRLDAAQRAAWREIVNQAPEGVLTGSDRLAVELAAVLLAEFRTAPAEFQAARLARLESLLSKFGMNPSDRSRLNIAPPAKRNAFDDL